MNDIRLGDDQSTDKAFLEMDLVTNSMTWGEEVYLLFGYDPHGFSPSRSDYLSRVHVKDRALVEQFFDMVIRTGQEHLLEHRIVVDGHQVKRLLLRARIKYDEKTNKLMLLGAVREIEVRDRREEPNVNGQEVTGLPPAPSPDSTLARLSFNLRTPLHSVANLLYLLQQTQLTTHQQELLTGLKSAADDLGLVTNQLLNYALLQAGGEDLTQVHAFTLHELLQPIRRLLSFNAERENLTTEFMVAADLPERVVGDQNRISQLIYCLIERLVMLAHPEERLFIDIRGASRGGQWYLNLSVRYRGLLYQWPRSDAAWLQAAEIRPEARAAILDAVIANVGIQLNVEATATTRPDLGVIVEAAIPLMPHENVSYSLPAKPAAPVRLLLVEDHPLQQIAIRQVLTSWSPLVQVDTADNGLEAVKRVQQHQIDLVLMDLKLPVMDGLEATREIRKAHRLPIIALTAGASPREEQQCRAAGMDDYLTKPFQPAELHERILLQLRRIGHPAAR